MNRHWEIIPEDRAMRALVLILGFSRPNTGQGIGDTLILGVAIWTQAFVALGNVLCQKSHLINGRLGCRNRGRHGQLPHQFEICVAGRPLETKNASAS